MQKLIGISTDRFRIWLTAAVVLYMALALFHGLFGYYFWGQSGFSLGNDDAFISFRYSQNLIDTGILSFNPSDDPPVEGFSNPIYVAVAALVYFFVGQDYLYPAMAVLGAFAVAFAIVRVAVFAQPRIGGQASVTVALVLALCPSLWVHGTSGLETAWVFLLQVLLWISCVSYAESPQKRGFWAILLLSAGLVLLRIDGFVIPVIVALWFVWRGDFRLAIGIIGTCAAVFFAVMAVRLAYYGLPMPLTYYVKVSGPLTDRIAFGIKLIASIAVKNGMAFALAGVGVASLIFLRKVFARTAFDPPPLDVWLVGGLLAYYIYIGGDIYRDRFLILIFPLGVHALLRFVTAGSLAPWAVAVGGLTVVGQFVSLGADPRFDYRFEEPKYDQWVTLGRFLADNHAGEVLATGAAGKIPFYSGLETIDMLGLNNRHIALTEAQEFIPGHNKFDVDYVLASRPDVICSHTFGDGSMTYGLGRDVYTQAGYAMRYLVGADNGQVRGVFDVAGRSTAEIAAMISEGARYGCLVQVN